MGRLAGLMEATTYDCYCFAEDMSGNRMDGTPAWIANPSAINSTKFAGIQTLFILQATRLRITNATGAFPIEAQPATWNVHLPLSMYFGSRECRDFESRHAPNALS